MTISNANLFIPKNVDSKSDDIGFLENILDLAQKISNYEKRKLKFVSSLDFLRDLDLSFLSPIVHDELGETVLVHKVNPTNLTGLTVAGVDGGLISKSLHNFDLVLTRAVACIFHFQKNRPVVQYITSESPRPLLHYNFKPYSRTETDLFATLERIKCEIKLAQSIFNNATPEAILLDGSILPLPSDRPSSLNNPQLYRKYETLIKEFESLYDLCLTHKTILAGCIKDTRSSRLVKFLGKIIPNLFHHKDNLNVDLNKIFELDYRKVIELLRDTDFLSTFLEVGERTAVMNYFENKAPIYKDLDPYFADRLKLFYLKTVEYDIPMRVEVLTLNSTPLKTIRKISSILYPLSSYHSKYGVPTVLIEADARAKLNENDLELIYDMLYDSVPGSIKLLKLRRYRRPF
ncbi:MAG: DNA double-strand break repair nuclease NurA [Candidatus Helarchaeota archaeon]